MTISAPPNFDDMKPLYLVPSKLPSSTSYLIPLRNDRNTTSDAKNHRFYRDTSVQPHQFDFPTPQNLRQQRRKTSLRSKLPNFYRPPRAKSPQPNKFTCHRETANPLSHLKSTATRHTTHFRLAHVDLQQQACNAERLDHFPLALLQVNAGSLEDEIHAK